MGLSKCALQLRNDLRILEIHNSAVRLEWYQHLEPERDEKVKVYQCLLKNEARLLAEFGGEEQQLEVLTGMKHGMSNCFSVLTPRELGTLPSFVPCNIVLDCVLGFEYLYDRGFVYCTRICHWSISVLVNRHGELNGAMSGFAAFHEMNIARSQDTSRECITGTRRYPSKASNVLAVELAIYELKLRVSLSGFCSRVYVLGPKTVAKYLISFIRCNTLCKCLQNGFNAPQQTQTWIICITTYQYFQHWEKQTCQPAEAE